MENMQSFEYVLQDGEVVFLFRAREVEAGAQAAGGQVAGGQVAGGQQPAAGGQAAGGQAAVRLARAAAAGAGLLPRAVTRASQLMDAVVVSSCLVLIT